MVIKKEITETECNLWRKNKNMCALVCVDVITQKAVMGAMKDKKK